VPDIDLADEIYPALEQAFPVSTQKRNSLLSGFSFPLFLLFFAVLCWRFIRL